MDAVVKPRADHVGAMLPAADQTRIDQHIAATAVRANENPVGAPGDRAGIVDQAATIYLNPHAGRGDAAPVDDRAAYADIDGGFAEIGSG